MKTATKELRMRKITRAELSFMIVLLCSLSMSKNFGWTNSLENIFNLFVHEDAPFSVYVYVYV